MFNNKALEAGKILDKNNFVLAVGNYLNSIQLQSLIKCTKFGGLKPSDSPNKIRRSGGGGIAETLSQTMRHHNVSKDEWLEVLIECKKIADNK